MVQRFSLNIYFSRLRIIIRQRLCYMQDFEFISNILYPDVRVRPFSLAMIRALAGFSAGFTRRLDTVRLQPEAQHRKIQFIHALGWALESDSRSNSCVLGIFAAASLYLRCRSLSH